MLFFEYFFMFFEYSGCDLFQIFSFIFLYLVVNIALKMQYIAKVDLENTLGVIYSFVFNGFAYIWGEKCETQILNC
jgi:hypothetical protein